MSKISLMMIAAIGLIAAGCSSNSKKPKMASEMEEGEINESVEKAKQVFYALPSPVETAYLIQTTGVPYNVDLANPAENASNYTTTFQKALNFGVYGADLSYAGLFNQTQTSIRYMATAKKMADELGILEFVKNDIVERIEHNINNRDSLMEILTEGFVGSSDYLKETGRAEVAALIAVGGWIEGLYLSTSLADLAANNEKLKDLVVDQRLSLSILLKLLDNYKSSPNVAKVYEWLVDLQNTYNSINTVASEISAEVTSDGKTVLGSSQRPTVNDVIFDAICHKADSIRSLIVD
ncbi:MAG: hypothetical protein J6U13_06020 [Salinivirgaceae bacterium]|nr:hypothetical protein [Salinivirgaceae bacterium]